MRRFVSGPLMDASNSRNYNPILKIRYPYHFQALPEIVQKITSLENEATLLDSSGEVFSIFSCNIHWYSSV